jgi:hypothetical protein
MAVTLTQTPQVLRTRATIAQINAGLELLPALAGYAYRMIDMAMIAVGGAAATATSVDINATRAAGAIKLLVVAVAALTQSAIVRAGAANAVILADGASFTACDANTAITLGKAGSSLATATHVDVILTYVTESA